MASTLLDEALEGWRCTREGVIAELDNIPPESFGFRAAPAVPSIAESYPEFIVQLIEGPAK